MTEERDNPKDLAAIPGETGSGLKQNPEEQGSRRDPEEPPVEQHHQIREKTMDKTLADSFPISDPPSIYSRSQLGRSQPRQGKSCLIAAFVCFSFTQRA